MKETYIHGYKVKYEDTAKSGADYLLYSLDLSEVKIFFDQARNKGKADFENNQGTNFTLDHNPDATYTIIRRG